MVAAGDSNNNVTYMPGIKPLLNPTGDVRLDDADDMDGAAAADENEEN